MDVEPILAEVDTVPIQVIVLIGFCLLLPGCSLELRDLSREPWDGSSSKIRCGTCEPMRSSASTNLTRAIACRRECRARCDAVWRVTGPDFA